MNVIKNDQGHCEDTQSLRINLRLILPYQTQGFDLKSQLNHSGPLVFAGVRDYNRPLAEKIGQYFTTSLKTLVAAYLNSLHTYYILIL